LELGAKELTAPVWKEQSGVMESGLEQFVAASLELPLEFLVEASFLVFLVQAYRLDLF
jgi:hypothetical protein